MARDDGKDGVAPATRRDDQRGAQPDICLSSARARLELPCNLYDHVPPLGLRSQHEGLSQGRLDDISNLLLP